MEYPRFELSYNPAVLDGYYGHLSYVVDGERYSSGISFSGQDFMDAADTGALFHNLVKNILESAYDHIDTLRRR